MPLSSLSAGVAFRATLIVAIGPRATFVLRQGVAGRHTRTIFILCVLCDSLLIMSGVSGGAATVALVPGLDAPLKIAGATFIAGYGLTHFRHFLPRPVPANGAIEARPATLPAVMGLGRCVGALFLLTFLNPHVYLGTVMVLGSISAQYPSPVTFGIGAVLASTLFFGALCFGGRLLRPLLDSSTARQRFDLVIGCVMLVIAAGLAIPAVE